MIEVKRALWLRILVHAVFAWVLYVIQALILTHFRIFGVAPFILPLAVIAVGMFEGADWGAGFGIWAGVLADAAFSESTVMFTILFAALGFGVGFLGNHLLSRGFPSYLLCSLLALLGISLFQMFPLFVFAGQSIFTLVQVALVQTLYSFLFTLPMYVACRRLRK